jgi:hypothetical protein
VLLKKTNKQKNTPLFKSFFFVPFEDPTQQISLKLVTLNVNLSPQLSYTTVSSFGTLDSRKDRR